jgi:2-oxoglutarate dehydrogenase E1 component
LEEILNANEVEKHCKCVWVQEEPLNSGGFTFVQPRIQRAMENIGIKGELIYCGRRSLGSPAIGWTDGHKEESKELMEQIMELGLNA